jgi:hypothetical protein
MGSCCSDEKSVQSQGQHQPRRQAQTDAPRRTNNSTNMNRVNSSNNGSFKGGGRVLGGEATAADAREAAARAAEARQAKAAPGLSNDSSSNMKLNQQKAGLIGQIDSLCTQLNEEPPFGLNVCSVDQLMRHRKHLEERLKAKRSGR